MEMTQLQQGNEQLKPGEIVIPQETARALGKGLSQLLNEPIQAVKPYINNLKNNPQVDQDYVQPMEGAISRILAIPDNFEHAKKVKIVPLPEGLVDFAFSEERVTTGETPIQPEITIDDTTTPTLRQLTVFMQHHFNNSFQPLIGYPELIEESTDDPAVKQQAAEIASRSQSLHNYLTPILIERRQLKILTDATGSTTITAI